MLRFGRLMAVDSLDSEKAAARTVRRPCRQLAFQAGEPDITSEDVNAGT